MKTLSPNDAVTQLVDAVNHGNLETALALYEPGASFVVRPGLVITGTSAIREALARLIALKPILTTHTHKIVEADDIALYCSRWSMSGTDPAGNPVQQSNRRSSDVLRRQPDGNWLIALDNPSGTDILD